MTDELILLVPEAPAPQNASAGARERPRIAGGVRLGTLDNSKANAEPLLRMIAEAVAREVPLKSVIALNKNNASVPASPALYERLTSESDLVISAMAD